MEVPRSQCRRSAQSAAGNERRYSRFWREPLLIPPLNGCTNECGSRFLVYPSEQCIEIFTFSRVKERSVSWILVRDFADTTQRSNSIIISSASDVEPSEILTSPQWKICTREFNLMFRGQSGPTSSTSTVSARIASQKNSSAFQYNPLQPQAKPVVKTSRRECLNGAFMKSVDLIVEERRFS